MYFYLWCSLLDLPVVVEWIGLCCCVGQCSYVLVWPSCLFLVKAPLPLVPWLPWFESRWSQTIELQDSNKSEDLKHQTNHSDYFDKSLMFNLHSVTVNIILPRMNSIICMKPLLVTQSISPTPWPQPLPPYFANSPSVHQIACQSLSLCHFLKR